MIGLLDDYIILYVVDCNTDGIPGGIILCVTLAPRNCFGVTILDVVGLKRGSIVRTDGIRKKGKLKWKVC